MLYELLYPKTIVYKNSLRFINILIISTVLKLTVPTVRLCFIPVVTRFHYYNIFIITIYKCIEFIHNIINRNRLSVIRIIRNTDYVKINICKEKLLTILCSHKIEITSVVCSFFQVLFL